MSKRYIAQTRADGRTFIEEDDNSGDIGVLLLFFILGFLVVGIVMLISATTGVNVFDYLEGIPGPCGTCTPQ